MTTFDAAPAGSGLDGRRPPGETGETTVIKTAALTVEEVAAGRLSEVAFDGRPPILLIGFAPPCVDFATAAAAARGAASAETELVLVSSAGGLLASHGECLYRSGDDDALIFLAFSSRLLAAVSVHAIPLHREVEREDGPDPAGERRVAAIRRELEAVSPGFPLDHRDTIALSFVDGVSGGENRFMEAVYASGRFPLLFVGGSAGGTLDFVGTDLFDGRSRLRDHAIVVFMKLAAGKRYGVFKTQNFEKLPIEFTVFDGDPASRTVSSVIDPETLEVVGFIEAVRRALGCEADELERRLDEHSFAVDVDGEMFVRSVARIDHAKGVVEFYCDINPGDVLHLVKATSFVERTSEDFERFLRDKPRPLGGLLNDCILRRLNNADSLWKLRIFDDLPVAGFSTFGELFGIDINQTLSAIFFFDDRGDAEPPDPWMVNFPIQYARFQLYFRAAKNTRLSVFNRLRQRLIRNLISRSDGTVLPENTAERIRTGAERPTGDEVGEITGTALELHSAFVEAERGREEARETLLRREMELRFAEERRAAAEARADLEARLNQARRLEALGRMAGGLAHEINNMLQPIVGICDLVRNDFPEGTDNHDSLTLVIEAARRIESITDQVRMFGQSMNDPRRPISLSAAVRDAIDIVRHLPPPNVELRWEIDDADMLVEANETQVVRILTLLVRNAVDAIGDEGGAIEISLDRRAESEMPGLSVPPGSFAGGGALLTVRDDGCGMDAETVERVFDPFFTTKAVGKGTGMGLPVVRGIVESWSGAVSVESELGRGTVLKVFLPLFGGADARFFDPGI